MKKRKEIKGNINDTNKTSKKNKNYQNAVRFIFPQNSYFYIQIY